MLSQAAPASFSAPCKRCICAGVALLSFSAISSVCASAALQARASAIALSILASIFFGVGRCVNQISISAPIASSQ